MKLTSKFKYLVNIVLKTKHIVDLYSNPDFEYDRISGELIRNVHSIEKGLSLRNVRPCFGYQKIVEASQYAEKLISVDNEYYREIVCMYVDALDAYLNYHKQLLIEDEKLNKVKIIYDNIYRKLGDRTNAQRIGGVYRVRSVAHTEEEQKTVERLIKQRHSVREFSDVPVSMESLNRAIELASHCPSACNRQGYRVHIVTKRKMNVFDGWFEGVGGFADEIDKMLLITAKVSSYRPSEEFQYIVTSSVFAGYLTIALEANNIGCCFIQRPVLFSKKWKRVAEKLSIPKDEQIICALGVGNFLEEYKVPLSHRIPIIDFVKTHE